MNTTVYKQNKKIKEKKQLTIGSIGILEFLKQKTKSEKKEAWMKRLDVEITQTTKQTTKPNPHMHSLLFGKSVVKEF